MQKLVWQNADGIELDLTSGNYGITEWEGFSNTGLNIQSQQVPFQDGGVFLDALIEQRELTVTLAIQDRNNLELRYQQRRELISALNPKLGEGYLIYTNDFISKRIKCVPQIPLFETHNSDMSGTPKASLTWTACEPYWEDLEETVVSIQNGIQKITNNGDVETQVRINLIGNSDVSVLNNTTNKKIELPLDGSVEINTETGNKSVTTLELEIVENYYNVYIDSVAYNPADDLYAILGNDNYIYTLKNNIMTKKSNVGFDKIKWLGIVGAFVGIRLGNYTRISTDNCETWESLLNNINDIFYDKETELYIAVGTNGIIKTSPDLETWTSQTSGTNQSLNCVTRDSLTDKIIIVGNGGTVLLSSDGITWETNSGAPNISIMSYSSDSFGSLGVAVGYNGEVYSKKSMNNWNNLGTITDKILENVFYDVISQEWSISSSDGVYKTDGYTVTEIDTGDYNLSKLSFSEETQTIFYSGASSNILKKNEDEFIPLCYPFPFAAKNIFYIKEKGFYVVISDSAISISEDLRNSRIVYSSEDNIYLKQFCYNGQMALVGGYGVIVKSTDFENWELVEIELGYNCVGIEWAKKLNTFFIGFEEKGVYKTTDAETFSFIYDSGNYSLCLCWSEKLGILVILNGSGDGVYTENGIDLQNITFIGGSPHYRTIAYSEERNLFLACGHDPSVNISTDGKTFKQSGTFITEGYDVKWSAKEKAFLVVDEYALIKTPEGKNYEKYTNLKDYETINVSSNKIVLTPLGIIENKNTENKINTLSDDSDMTFNLQSGSNDVVISSEGSVFGTLSYRQKYIGV